MNIEPQADDEIRGKCQSPPYHPGADQDDNVEQLKNCTPYFEETKAAGRKNMMRVQVFPERILQ